MPSYVEFQHSTDYDPEKYFTAHSVVISDIDSLQKYGPKQFKNFRGNLIQRSELIKKCLKISNLPSLPQQKSIQPHCVNAESINCYLCVPVLIVLLTRFSLVSLFLFNLRLCICCTFNVIKSVRIKSLRIMSWSANLVSLFLYYLNPAVTSIQIFLDSFSVCSTIGLTFFLKIGMQFTSTNVSGF